MPVKYRIRLKPDAVPFAAYMPRRVPVNLLAPSNAKLEKLEAANVIKRIEEPSEWCTPTDVVPKRASGSDTTSGSAIRLCMDLTHLNNYVQREQFSLPVRDQLLARLAGATVFSKIDHFRFPPGRARRRLDAANYVYDSVWPLVLSTRSLWHFVG
jgi:hypothetical protein